MTLPIRSTLTWFGMLVLAFVNGALREFVLKNKLGMVALQANQISCLTGVVILTSFAWFVWDRLGISNWKQVIRVGGAWFAATLLFETFILNRHLSWAEILHTYDISAGEYWGLVLLAIGLMPVAVFSIKRR